MLWETKVSQNAYIYIYIYIYIIEWKMVEVPKNIYKK